MWDPPGIRRGVHPVPEAISVFVILSVRLEELIGLQCCEGRDCEEEECEEAC